LSCPGAWSICRLDLRAGGITSVVLGYSTVFSDSRSGERAFVRLFRPIHTKGQLCNEHVKRKRAPRSLPVSDPLFFPFRPGSALPGAHAFRSVPVRRDPRTRRPCAPGYDTVCRTRTSESIPSAHRQLAYRREFPNHCRIMPTGIGSACSTHPSSRIACNHRLRHV
jgi:hypothetical protein